MNLTDWIGSVGVFLILLAYLLNITKKISSDDLSFKWLNILGAALACVASVRMNYVPFIILESVWVLASILALFNFNKETA